MKKVGIVAMSAPAHGGTYQYTLSTIDALRRLDGIQCILYTTEANRSYDHLGLPNRRLPSGIAALARILGAIAGLPVRKWFAEVDVVIAPIYTPYLLASKPPFAFTLHDLQERYYPEYFSLAQRVWRNTMNALLVRRASRIVCESRWVKGDIEKFLHAEPAKITVIPAPPVNSFVSEELSAQRIEDVQRKLDLPAQFLFYPAQFFAHKNHFRLVNAFQRVVDQYPDCCLLFTGQRKYEYERVFERVAELGLTARVRHLGYLETADLAAVYASARAVVIPTLFESISIPMYEAFALGVPVCVSSVVALPEQAGDAALLFDPTDSEDIAEKVSRLLGDPELALVLAARGRARVGELSVDQYANYLRQLLNEIG